MKFVLVLILYVLFITSTVLSNNADVESSNNDKSGNSSDKTGENNNKNGSSNENVKDKDNSTAHTTQTSSGSNNQNSSHHSTDDSTSSGNTYNNSNTTYTTDQSEHEMNKTQTYQENNKYVSEHNKKYQDKQSTFKLKLNGFKDLNSSEFNRIYNGYGGKNGSAGQGGALGKPFSYDPKATIKKSIDYRNDSCTTDVKYQGACGSCWTFSAVGALEYINCKNNNSTKVVLSEQNLLDCVKGGQQCNGGFMSNAFNYVTTNKGIATNQSYPYVEKPQTTCNYNKSVKGGTCNKYSNIQKGNETHLMQAIATVGPVSVAIDASHSSFQFYSEGIYNEPKCSSTKLNHAVLAVGYGTDANGTDYWIIKNSYGVSWGDKGYAKMIRNKNNQCGIASEALYPLI